MYSTLPNIIKRIKTCDSNLVFVQIFVTIFIKHFQHTNFTKYTSSLQHFTVVLQKNDNFKISTEFNNQNLSCKANVPVNKTRAKELGLSGLKKTDSAKMEITCKF